MREKQYCAMCKGMVYADDVHSCWDADALERVRDAERAVIEAAEVFDALVNDHGWSLGAGMDGVVTLSTMTPRTLSVAVTELMDAVRALHAARQGEG